MINFENKKVLFIDLDGTLIKTISGKTFPEDITDFRIQLPVLNKVIEKFPNLEYFFIVTNQGGIGKFITEDDFKTKISSICMFCAKITAEHPELPPLNIKETVEKLSSDEFIESKIKSVLE